MKKFSALLLALLLVVLAGCTAPDNLNSNSENASSDITSSETSSVSTSSKETDDDQTSSKSQTNSTSSKSKTSSVTTSSKKETPSYSSDKVTPTETSSNKVTNTETSSKKTNTETSSQKSNETSSKEPTTTEPSVDTTPEDTPLDEVEEGVVCYTYAINGTIVDWFVEGELVHAIFKQVNRYAAFDTTTGQIVIDKALSGRPAKIRKYGDELWISYPDLQCIKIHDSKTFSVKNTISLTTEVSSFDVYGDYLIYTEDDQHVYAYRYNMKTSESVNIKTEHDYTFYKADVLVNNELGYVYIGESGGSGSAIYCFDIETLALTSKYRKDNYGYTNHKRRTFLLGDYVYWGEFKLNAKNIAQVEGQYTGQYPAGMLFVNEALVATTNGIYLNSTYEQIASGYFNDFDSCIAITDSGNMLITKQGELYIFSQQQ